MMWSSMNPRFVFMWASVLYLVSNRFDLVLQLLVKENWRIFLKDFNIYLQCGFRKTYSTLKQFLLWSWLKFAHNDIFMVHLCKSPKWNDLQSSCAVREKKNLCKSPTWECKGLLTLFLPASLDVNFSRYATSLLAPDIAFKKKELGMDKLTV